MKAPTSQKTPLQSSHSQQQQQQLGQQLVLEVPPILSGTIPEHDRPEVPEPKILSGLIRFAKHHIVDRTANRIYSNISKVPGLHLLLQWMWRKLVEQHLNRVAQPCAAIASILGKYADVIDAALSVRAISLLKATLECGNIL